MYPYCVQGVEKEREKKKKASIHKRITTGCLVTFITDS